MGVWIPVGQEYPRDNTQVLVTKDVFGKPMVSIAGFTFNLHELDPYDFSGKEFRREGFVCYDSEYGYVEVTGVTAWMPLPEPWKGE